MKQIIVYKGGAGFLRNTRRWVSNLFKRRRGKPKHKQPHVQTHAKIASESYSPPASRKTTIDGYQYQPHVSHSKRAVYHHPDKNHSIVGHRGTDPSDSDDLLDDIALATGQNLRENDRYKDESRFLKDFKKQNKGTKVSLSGHSLAGEYVKHLGHEHDLETHAFNPGTSPTTLNLGHNLKHALNPKINTYAVNTDIISTTDPFVKNRIKRTASDSHTIRNFIDGGKQQLLKHFHAIYQLLD